MIRFALAQLNFLVGDIDGNLQKALRCVNDARKQRASLLVFPELALTGYPPEDLLLRPGFMGQVRNALNSLVRQVQDLDVVIGHPWYEEGNRFNAASWIREGRILGRYFKRELPNYLVFDEQRYFQAGTEPLVVQLEGLNIGVIICEDSWEPEASQLAQKAGAEFLVMPNASPYRHDKQQARTRMLQARFAETGLPAAYCNLVGGQDELVFDGRSMVMDRQGKLSVPGPHCRESLMLADFDPGCGTFSGLSWPAEESDLLAEIYRALTTGLRDYVHKNGFKEVVFGLSGGIDSALTLTLAVDALGADRVHTVMMPSRHTSQLSLELAQDQAVRLGVDHRCISIEEGYEALMGALKPSFEGLAAGLAEENLQARLRGNIVMALSNKFGWLPLATSNKSEAAVGYCTIYGDMCGGLGPLLDCFKTRVYELAQYRNTISAAIPEAVIDRPPSAELRPDQYDEDSLPPYDLLDQILERYVEKDESVSQIVSEGFDERVVRQVAGLVLQSEYKRRQAPPAIRITSRAFGRDRRYPITSGFRDANT